MNKREFLAMGGAVPLMLAGCGGGGTGSAPVRLINASVGYPLLGFMVNTTQATTADVAYGAMSPFETVQAGSVTTSLTVTTNGQTASVSSSTRTLSKSNSYDLVAYGYLNELKSVLLTESTVAPDSGDANVNVLNTSVDIGAVDVYVSPGTDLSVATQIASSVTGVSQSIFTGVLAGSYFITVVGAGSLQAGISDIRFQSPAAITLVDQQIMTIILTPGASGTLANAILLTQGTSGSVVSYTNATARVRAVSAINNGTTIQVTTTSGSTTTDIVPVTTTPTYTDYFVVPATSAPSVLVNGVSQGAIGSLTAGGDYTLMIYTDPTSGNVTQSLLLDDNTAPTVASGVKFRLINLAASPTGVTLSMTVNSVPVATNVPYATASTYADVAEPQTTASVVEIFNGSTSLKTLTPQVLQAGRIFTEIVVDITTNPIQDFFLASTND